MGARIVLLGFFAVAAACGGGGSSPGSDPVLLTAALEGYVYEVDGQTEDRAGVPVLVVETGQATTTDAEGRFAFAGVPSSGITLDFGSTRIALAKEDGVQSQEQEQEHAQEKAQEQEQEGVEDEDEDENGNPQMNGLENGDRVQVRCSVEDGEVNEFFMAAADRLRAMVSLTRVEDSPDADVCGKVKIETRDDREKFQIEVNRLTPGVSLNIHMAPPPAEGADPEFSFIAPITANAEGRAELERNTKNGDSLPFDAATVADLEGYLIEVRLDDTDEPLMLTGEVPALPESWPAPGEGMQEGVRARARAELTLHAGTGEGRVELRRREQSRQCLRIEAEGLQPGEGVGFFLETARGSGEHQQIATATANGEGECEAEFEGTLPGNHGDVSELVGLEIQVRHMNGEQAGDLLMSAIIPALVAD